MGSRKVYRTFSKWGIKNGFVLTAEVNARPKRTTFRMKIKPTSSQTFPV